MIIPRCLRCLFEEEKYIFYNFCKETRKFSLEMAEFSGLMAAEAFYII